MRNRLGGREKTMGQFGLMNLSLGLWAALVLFAGQSNAQKFEANYDEAKIPEFELPAVAPEERLSKASHPEFASYWKDRRSELVELFSKEMYGSFPKSPCKVGCELIESGMSCGGKARRMQYRVTLSTDAGELPLNLLVFIPADAKEPVPAFMGYSFYGNHTVADDAEIELTEAWSRNSKDKGVVDNRATSSGRGTSKTRWPVEQIVDSGYGLVTAYYGDIDPDVDDGFNNGIHRLFPEHKPSAEHLDRWGSISAWAWGMGRFLDACEQIDLIDETKVIAIGHSRLGKTSLWAAATDSRFAAGISNNSGCGGAALSKRAVGETVGRINDVFPHWFCGNFKKYNLNESELPFDQHQLIASIAPRPVYVASASGDRWADPKGELLAAFTAAKFYERLGYKNTLQEELPDPGTDFQGQVSYHLRDGKHNITSWDWERYIDFANQIVFAKSPR
ncbi:MAG: acetylxylan esterase [Planctomycetota bacterium]